MSNITMSVYQGPDKPSISVSKTVDTDDLLSAMIGIRDMLSEQIDAMQRTAVRLHECEVNHLIPDRSLGGSDKGSINLEGIRILHEMVESQGSGIACASDEARESMSYDIQNALDRVIEPRPRCSRM